MMKTGRASLARLSPATRKLVISLSLDIRPNTSSTAERKPHGMVNISENGSTFTTKRSTRSNGACCSTSSGRACLKRFPITSTRLSTTMAYSVPTRICLPM